MNKGDCEDCGVSTHKRDGDYYMVIPEIWNQYGLGGSEWSVKGFSWKETRPSGMLCMPCLETRMGRKLRLSDLMDAPINEFWFNHFATI